MTRVAIEASGIVQGVGMRPFVHRTALERGLVGWVHNEAGAVRIEVQGQPGAVRAFLETLKHRCPAPASIERIVVREIDEQEEEQTFRILGSVAGCEARPAVPADLAVCDECASEVDDPTARRYRYPFANCAHCGPRFTIVERLPYDRSRTSMKAFAMCSACAAEYNEPADRRFHAQPIACPACGPALSLVSPQGNVVGRGDAALRLAAAAVRTGQVLALKGIGGYQLVADAMSAPAVARLRTRKHREAKPLAVMFPSLEALERACVVSAEEQRALASPAAPIVLVVRKGDAPLAAGVAPNNSRIGAMLPYSPLHRLLLREVARPVVCTSGNRTDEPICIEDADALDRLGSIADGFLVHDRPVVRPADDSVGRIGGDGLTLLRRARGYAPLPVRLAEPTPVVLALGAQLKNTVALAIHGQVVVSQQLGDLSCLEAARLAARTVEDLLRFHQVRPDVVACDLHPDYASTRLAEHLARSYGVPLERVQHHHAHVAACVAEHGLAEPVLGIAWDGSGYGGDGTIWGGEFLLCEGAHAVRAAHLRPYRLPGGERAVRDPRRAAFGVLHEQFGQDATECARAWFGAGEAAVLAGLMTGSVLAPRTTSMGRLFDAMSALLGTCHTNRFEGEAAAALEFAAEGVDSVDPYPIAVHSTEPAVADWEPLVAAVLADRRAGVPAARISARFHETLAALAEEVAVHVGVSSVVLTGGCFQNARLARRAMQRLAARGFHVHAPRSFPPNDGGISLGQALVASRRFLERGAPCA
jgi:hydrogenase maturation protein HypF